MRALFVLYITLLRIVKHLDIGPVHTIHIDHHPAWCEREWPTTATRRPLQFNWITNNRALQLFDRNKSYRGIILVGIVHFRTVSVVFVFCNSNQRRIFLLSMLPLMLLLLLHHLHRQKQQQQQRIIRVIIIIIYLFPSTLLFIPFFNLTPPAPIHRRAVD